MSTEENKLISRRFLDEVIGEHSLEAADEIYAPSMSFRAPGGLTADDRDAWKALLQVFFDAFPDLTAELETQVAEGDVVVTRFTYRGTHEGDLMGIPASGNQVTVPAVVIDRIEDHQIVEGWEIYDNLEFMQQIGAIPVGVEA